MLVACATAIRRTTARWTAPVRSHLHARMAFRRTSRLARRAVGHGPSRHLSTDAASVLEQVQVVWIVPTSPLPSTAHPTALWQARQPVTLSAPATIYAGVCLSETGHTPATLSGWQSTGESMVYTDTDRSQVTFFSKIVQPGVTLSIENDGTWCGTIVAFRPGTSNASF